MSLFNFFSSKKEETPFFLNALIQKAIYTTLDSPVIEVLAQTINLDKALALVKEHFTFTADDIANTYQKSYRYALVAISAGLAAPDEKFDFIQQLNQSKLSRDFSDNIESDYLQPFATQCGVKSEVLREQFLEHIKELSSKPLNLQADQSPLSETDLSASLQKQSAITDVILQSIDLKQPQLRDFFCFQELLGYAVLYFFREIIKKDSRVEKTLAALQREGLWADVRDMKTAQETLTVSIQEEINTLKAIAIKSIENGDFSKPEQLQPQLTRLQTSIDDVPKRLQTAQASLQEIIDFSHRFENWTALLETKVEEVLIALDVLQWTIGKIDNNVEMLLQEFRQFMLRCHLSPQIKMSDEFTYHDSESRQLIKSTVNKLKALPFHKTRYNQVVMMAGSVLSSTGDIVESEKFFLQAQNNAQNSEEKALASFNLFQAQLRNQEYEKALSNLCTAIDINASHYALHDIDRYPIIRLLGAGGMGCVFLCHDQWREKKLVVKCFWEGRQGTRDEVFGEALMMRKVAGDYVPKPLDCGYADMSKQKRPYFVTEYIEGAIDGEQWLKAHGKLDIKTGIAVGLSIAKGLQIAAHKGIMHLDLKPANVLFKHTDTGITVKIIDFGLSKIAISLSQEAQSHQTAHTQFGKSIISGTWDYAPPEQLGLGIPSAKSDIYAFGATLYRLMTLESPRHLNPRRLSQSPKLFELLCDCKEENPDNRPDIDTVVQQLSVLLQPKTSKKISEKTSEKISEKTNKTQKTGDIIRDRLKDGSEGAEMVIIPAGRFKMGGIQGAGDSNEKPVHTVTLDGFAMGRYAVTFAEYDVFAKTTGNDKPDDQRWGRDNRPVINVNWNDATAYVLWLSEQTGQTYRLPTEAEWEYAARAGTETNYCWGNKIGKNLCNCRDSESQWSGKRTAPVGSFEPNPWGLYDTEGNVWEWVQDWYGKSYYNSCLSNEHNPTGPSTARSRVRRGGCWNNGATSVRSVSRGRCAPRNRHSNLGFRLVRNYP